MTTPARTPVYAPPAIAEVIAAAPERLEVRAFKGYGDGYACLVWQVRDETTCIAELYRGRKLASRKTGVKGAIDGLLWGSEKHDEWAALDELGL